MKCVKEIILLSAVLLYLADSVYAQVCNNNNIRLREGMDHLEGRVEVCFQGQWGTVCDDSWDFRDAMVACRQLGHTSKYAIAITYTNNNGIFGPGAGAIFLDNVDCIGNETNLANCSHNGVGDHNCRHSEDAGVICSQVPDCNNTDIQLVGKKNNLEFQGRVEVCFQGQWGTVCGDSWDFRDAIVACRQLNLTSEYAVALTRANQNGIFDQGTGPIFLDNVNCTGDETNLKDCPHNGVGVHNCHHWLDAGVVCQQVAACNDTDIRLIESGSNLEGRVEVCYHGQWGTVCDDSWDTRDAMVVCRQLGLTTEYAAAINVGRSIGHNTGSIFLDDVNCRGNETNLADCPHNGVGNHNCFHWKDAGVICLQAPVCNTSDIRLQGGRNNLEGRVEVCFQGQWGTVCGDLWDYRDAVVACKQLNLTSEYAAPILRSRFIRPGTGPIFLDDVDCRGNETNLEDCPHRGVGVHNCRHTQDAGMICQQAAACNNTDIRLMGGRNNSEGRVEVCFQGQWGTVCDDDSWDTRDAMVVCRQLNLTSEYAVAINVWNGIFALGIGPIFLHDVDCRGNETNLDDCSSSVLVDRNCDHYKDAGAICPQAAVCNNSDIRIKGGTKDSNGRVEVCYQGQWGTVCDDAWHRLWDTNDAEVVCRQLGPIFEYAVAIKVDSGYFAPGTGLISFAGVNCRGNETKLADCPHNKVTYYGYCLHRQDVGVICLPTRDYVVTPNTSTHAPEPTSSNDSASVIGGTMGGALIVIILLLVLVVIIAVVVMRRKKAAVQSLQLEVLARPPIPSGINQQNSSHIESGGACNSLKNDGSIKAGENLTVPNPYSHHSPSALLRPDASTGKLLRVGSSYVRQLTEEMLISQENIKLLKCIGQGEFGIVYKAQLTEMKERPSLKTVAVKTLKGFFDQNEINKIMEESVKMKQFKHPNVMNLIGVCMDAGPAPYIVMPFMANGSLLSYLRKERPNLLLDENVDEDLVLEVKKRLTVMCSQIASGMEYLTKESFIHRDLAARNCMIDAHFVIKITDFGLSEDVYARNYFRQGQGSSVKLPVKWMAPESLQDGVFSDKTDVWSFGVTCWEIFSGGKTPYPGVDPPAMVQLLENGRRLDKPANSACPDEMYSIMLKCWNSDPNERPSFSVLVKFISGFAEKTAGYLDVSNYNPFEANIPTATKGEELGDIQTKEEHDTNVGVSLDDSPVVINVQCPSENGSLIEDSLV